MLTIVLDTNILVGSFLTPHGENWEVVRRAKGQKLCLSPFILTEVWRTLRVSRLKKKYRYSDTELVHYLQYLRAISHVRIPKQPVRACADPDDDHVLACAVDVHADYLVTRNVKDFPKTYRGVSIITPGKFLRLVTP
jgi:putative PIN family toxin of toxin-antitoxin system